MLASTPFPEPIKENGSWVIKGREKEVTLTKSLENDIKNMEDAKSKGLRWNWQQLLRALVPHVESMKKCI